jgi:uncharacterized protein YjbI with pentapeptide repeats
MLVKMTGKVFKRVDFSNLDLDDHDFSGTRFISCNMYNIGLSGCDFSHGYLEDLKKCNCQKSLFDYAKIISASECDFLKAKFMNTKFDGFFPSDFDESTFKNVVFAPECDFSGAVFVNATFWNCTATKETFKTMNLTEKQRAGFKDSFMAKK